MDPRNRTRAIALVLGVAAVLLGCFAGGALATERSELERRLALPPFAYVGETDSDAAKIQQGLSGRAGAAAFIDSATDALAARPAAGTSLQEVAVSPDGSKVYVTDAYEPVLHVLDAETELEIVSIPLPGVEARDPNALSAVVIRNMETKFSYDLWRSCASDVACTPDGALVLVCSSAGLHVLDAATNKVVRTLSDFIPSFVAVSFDGKRAYVTADAFDTYPDHTFAEWFKVLEEAEDNRLVCLDLETWEIVADIETAVVAGLAVKPDDSQVFFSETYRKRVRVVDSMTLADRWNVSTEPSYSVGIGLLPSGAKAYVVCSADNGVIDLLNTQTVPTLPSAEDFFCAVIDTDAQEIVKRIPLEAY